MLAALTESVFNSLSAKGIKIFMCCNCKLVLDSYHFSDQNQQRENKDSIRLWGCLNGFATKTLLQHWNFLQIKLKCEVSTLHTLTSTLLTRHSTLFTSHFKINISYSTFNTPHSTLNTENFTLKCYPHQFTIYNHTQQSTLLIFIPKYCR